MNWMTCFRKIVIGPKVDLDVCGCALIRLLGGTFDALDEVSMENLFPNIPVEVVSQGQASPADLDDESVLCIECGLDDMDWADKENFDHHIENGPENSATMQAFDHVDFLLDHKPIAVSHQELVEDFRKAYGSLAEYIDLLDTKGPEALRHRQKQVRFPTLSDVFAGMLLTERDPVKQFHEGVRILYNINNPFGTIDGFDQYAKAKADNDRQLALAVKRAKWTITKTGHKLAYLETDFYGAPGALYGRGAEIVIAYSPKFGNPPVPKFTIAGNSIRVNGLLPLLDAQEEGWGGPATGTIIGSPRGGSKMTLKAVLKIVKDRL